MISRHLFIAVAFIAPFRNTKVVGFDSCRFIIKHCNESTKMMMMTLLYFSWLFHTALVSRLYSVRDRMINECGTIDGMSTSAWELLYYNFLLFTKCYFIGKDYCLLG
jgi:hypothetical protein